MSKRTRLIVSVAALGAVSMLPAGVGIADGAQQTSDVYGYADFYGVPHLGAETASGTGCGGDGSVGDVIPDGYWRGYIRDLRTLDLDVDLVCVYGNNVAPQLIADWTAQHPGEPQPWVPDGFMVNSNPRTRGVALSPSFFAHGTAWAGTGCPFNSPVTPFDQSRDVWIRIVNGQAALGGVVLRRSARRRPGAAIDRIHVPVRDVLRRAPTRNRGGARHRLWRQRFARRHDP